MTSTPLDEAEEYLRDLARRMTDPADGECLHCYVFRMLTFGMCRTAMGPALPRGEGSSRDRPRAEAAIPRRGL